VYALLFADAGLSTGAISSLFAIWSIVSFVAEVPSGALADSWSRRRLYALGTLLTAAGYATWILWPAYPGFVLGFVLWGVGGACGSGTLEAVVYDDLHAAVTTGPGPAEPARRAAGEAYARVMGRSGTVGILAMLAATLLATPVYAIGGYRLVGLISVVVVATGGLLALRLPSAPAGPADDEDDEDGGYLATLRDGVRQSVRGRRVAWAVLVAALVPGFTALDEYLPLMSRDKGAPTTVVPLLFAVTALAMAVGSALAGRFPAVPPRRLGALLAVAAALVAGGALTRSVLGMVAVSAAFGILQFAMVLTETRLQEVITGRARTTVLSVSGFLSEMFAVALYALFALDAPLPVLFALSAVPLAATAATAARRL
jgi:MFS family permease